MAPSIEKLSKYLNGKTGSTVLSIVEAEDGMINEEESVPWEGQKIPWDGGTCLVVVYYAMKFLSSCDHHGTLSDTIRRLDDLASQLLELEEAFLEILASKLFNFHEEESWTDEEKQQPEHEQERELSELYVNSFMSQVQKFFKVPKMQQLSEKDKSLLKENEILAGFMDFLLQILDSESHAKPENEQLFEVLRKELTFVLTFLGDIPFKEHCTQFSEHIVPITTQKADVIDSFLIVDSLLEDLDSLINCKIIDEIKDQVKTIYEEMTLARTFLKDTEVVQGTYNHELKEFSFQIRDAASEAEYLINSYAVGNIPLWYLNIRSPTVIHKIKLLGVKHQEIRKIYDMMRVLGAEENFKKKLSFQTTVDMDVDLNEDVVVGIEEEKSKILDDLTSGSKSRRIISIFGLPGLGKTTMANKLYSDPGCCDYFDERARCVVSQAYHKKNVLAEIFISLAASKSEKLDKEKVLKMGDELFLKLYQRLKGHRYLIILDDVWHSNVWDDLRTYFPDDGNGSRIIITSRIKDTAPVDSIFYPLPLLTEDQCWNLLEKKVFLEEPCPRELLCIGKELASKCQGLPLAVVVTAGILAKLEKRESVWAEVKRNLDSYIFDDPQGCLKILELSYEYLPNHLKLCFLYFGAFPEDAEIGTRKLVWLWVSEGFVRKQEQKSREDVAQEYLLDLINRSLVMIGKRRFDGGIKTCGIHDLLHDMCLRKANEGNFLKSIKEESSIYEKHQRLCVHPTANSLRTFSLHCRSLGGPVTSNSPSNSRMPLLRVFGQDHAFEDICRLVSLRYLFIDKLPHSTIDKLVNLEYLCLGSDVELMLSTILKMVKLRHIYSRSVEKFIKDCATDQTTNLESLGIVDIENQGDDEILRRSPYLRRLKCLCDGTWFPDLRSLTRLESLHLLFAYPFKGELTSINFPASIKKLTLAAIGLPWEELSIIGRLPNLWCLRLDYSAFKGEEWVTKDDEFQELRFLTIQRFSSLKQWITCSEHFAKLECLVLRECRGLQEIPSDLGNIPTLQTIEVTDSSLEASISAVRIEKDQCEYGNEELKVIINNSNWSKEKLVLELESDEE